MEGVGGGCSRPRLYLFRQIAVGCRQEEETRRRLPSIIHPLPALSSSRQHSSSSPWSVCRVSACTGIHATLNLLVCQPLTYKSMLYAG